MKPIIATITFLSIFLAFETYAEEKTIRLVCKYSHTIDGDDGKKHESSGESLVTVSYLESGKATIKKQGLGAKFSGTISSEEIRGETEYELTGPTSRFRETILINRYTGAFEFTFKTVGSKRILIHCGFCEPIAERRF
jgi:hypothetical protein